MLLPLIRFLFGEGWAFQLRSRPRAFYAGDQVMHLAASGDPAELYASGEAAAMAVCPGRTPAFDGRPDGREMTW